ncbi:YopX family protein [uncultured Streptococcus sp.]|uniref:YopX family protein n=1 Tax=uncultured Streptococcus sp. TaxID=83427 RepID=UPI0028D1D70D|nr:YopX family protein [uncultured Streptococcus sp.]
MIARYRAWHKTWEELEKVKRIRFDDEGDVTTVLFEGKILGVDTHADKIVLMQSTGLVDKNGKEIFEGDILAFETNDEVINVNVFWDEEHALFMFESKKYNEQEPLVELVENNTYPFEIIGNIFEKPELLEAIK